MKCHLDLSKKCSPVDLKICMLIRRDIPSCFATKTETNILRSLVKKKKKKKSLAEGKFIEMASLFQAP